MTEDANVGRPWKSVARSDADVDLLQRSIDHVENLLNRLEYGAVPTPPGGDGSGITVDVEAGRTARARADGPSTVTGSRTPAAQADALRITLEAHEEAYQIRAQAAAVHAKVVAESERLLVEAQQVCEQLRAGAISDAAAKADDLQTVTQTQADATERDTRKRVDAAIAEVAAEADVVRLLVHDTFSDVVARLSDALVCLQQLTAVIGPEAPLALALAERQGLHAAAEDPGSGERSGAGERLGSGETSSAGEGSSTDTFGGFPAEVSGADGAVTVESARAPITRGVAGGPIFRIARR